MAYSGLAFPAELTRNLSHNDRDELTGVAETGGLTGKNWSYEYDPIGNRQTAELDSGTPEPTAYFSNELNQYHRTEYDDASNDFYAQGLRYDDDGNLVEYFVSADMNCDGRADMGDVNPFTLAVNNPAGYAAAYPNCDIMNGDINGDGNVDFGDINALIALLGHNPNGGGGLRMEYAWDAEDRLIAAAPTAETEQAGDLKVEFAYDHLGRRVRKAVVVWDETLNGGQGDSSSDPAKGAYVRKFVWQDWLMVAELDGSDAVVRQYTWGLDLAGLGGGVGPAISRSLEDTGGIGGLLAVHQAAVGGVSAGDYLYCHDAIGNVGQPRFAPPATFGLVYTGRMPEVVLRETLVGCSGSA